MSLPRLDILPCARYHVNVHEVFVCFIRCCFTCRRRQKEEKARYGSYKCYIKRIIIDRTRLNVCKAIDWV